MLPVVLLLHASLSSAAYAGTRHVLVLSSSERPYAPQSGFADALMRDLVRSSREPIQFVEVSIQAARASSDAPDVATAQRVRSAFRDQALDLVMTIGGPAATFAQQFRHELFPDAPTLIAGVDRRFVEKRPLTDRETAVATEHDPALMIDEILRLLPDTRSVLVVVGSSQVEQFWLQEMQREFRRFGDRVQFIYTNTLSFDEIVERCRTMPARSAIFFAILALYGMGRGIVGGPLLSSEDLSRTTTQVALRVLAGESPGAIKTPTQRSGPPTYDARELRRWKIDERRLPEASVLLFREPTIWQRHQRGITFAALVGGVPAVILLTGLIRRRRSRSRFKREDRVVEADRLERAHADLSNLSRHLLQTHEQERAALATTLQQDVCQRMVALMLRLHNLRGAGRDGEVAEISEQLSRLVAEIAAAPDQVHQRLEILGLAAASRGFCENLSAQSGVALDFQDEQVPANLPPDIALALFRVLQEATLNAVVHSGSREVCVSLRGTGADIRLQVIDGGTGFDPRRAGPHGGIGLVAIRERLKLVNGDSAIESSPGEGTRFEAWVPLRPRA